MYSFATFMSGSKSKALPLPYQPPVQFKKKIQMNNLIPKHDQEQCILGSGAVIIVNPISPAIYCNVFMKSRFYQLISQSLGNYPYFLQLVHSFWSTNLKRTLQGEKKVI